MKNSRLSIAVILILGSALFVYLGVRLVAQLHFHKASTLLREGSYARAADHLKKTLRLQPGDAEAWKALGSAYHNMGAKGSAREAYALAKMAKAALEQGAQRNPLDAQTFYNLAREEGRLEQLYAYVHPLGENPHDALPHFEKAIGLRPYGIREHAGLVDYLHFKGREEDLLDAVFDLARVCPSCCGFLKRASFWGPTARESMRTGLFAALEEGTSIAVAHAELSSLYREQGELPKAVEHYQKSLASMEPSDVEASHLFRLGTLHLQNEEPQEAEEAFLKGLRRSGARGKDLERLFHQLRSAGKLDTFYSLYQTVKDRYGLPGRSEVLVARAMMEQQRYDEARWTLQDLNREAPHAEAYYWLARIAQKQGDADAEELAIQKAAVLDPKNSGYHLYFSRVLAGINKWERAEKEATRALLHASSPSAGLLNYRASLRWRQDDFHGACTDWESAIALGLKNPGPYHAKAAEACIKLGNVECAVSHYKKAALAEPGNEKYQTRLQALKAGS